MRNAAVALSNARVFLQMVPKRRTKQHSINFGITTFGIAVKATRWWRAVYAATGADPETVEQVTQLDIEEAADQLGIRTHYYNGLSYLGLCWFDEKLCAWPEVAK